MSNMFQYIQTRHASYRDKLQFGVYTSSPSGDSLELRIELARYVREAFPFTDDPNWDGTIPRRCSLLLDTSGPTGVDGDKW